MPRTPGERKEVAFSIKMSLEEMAYLDARKKELNYTSTAEVIRELVNSFRHWFGLPLFAAQRLAAEAEALNLSTVAYVREVLAKHAEELGRAESAAPKSRK